MTRNTIPLFTLLAVLALPCAAQLKVSTADAARAAVRKVQPEYTPMAKQMRIQGDVELELQVTESGDVAAVKVVSGNSLLTASATKAAKEWKFAPFTEGGKAVPAVVTLRFNFKI